MTDTVKIPGLGQVSKTTAYALGGGAVLVIVVAWYRSRDAAAEPAAAAGGDPSQQIDPATGYPYGSDPDLAALGQMAAIGAGPVGPGYEFQSGANISGGGGYPQGFTTNAAWSQAAEDYLVNTVHGGESADVIGNALGKYITGQGLSADQVAIVEQAIAFTGYPPVNGPTGYPPSYRTAAAAATPAAPTTPGTPAALRAPSRIFATAVGRTWIRFGWKNVAGASGYVVQQMGASGWQTIGHSGDTQYTRSGLHPGHSYKFRVAATSAGKTGPFSATLNRSTHR